MKILLVAATAPEIAPSLATLKEKGIDVLVTGVGMVATAYQLGKTLEQTPHDLLVNVGIAGSFSREFQLGDIVRVVEDQFIELGAEDRLTFVPIEQLGLGQSIFSSPTSLILRSLANIPAVHGITVNTVHGNSHSIERVKEKVPAHTVESMEGASVFFAAQEAKIPAIQVRAISNYVEPRNRDHWNIDLAIENLNVWIEEFSKEITDL